VSTPATDRTPVQETAAEDSVRKRVQLAYDKFLAGSVKLDQQPFEEFKYGVVDNVVIVILSSITGAVYAIDRQTGTFYRTISPTSTKLVASAPREVIREDREWLYGALSKTIPGGALVLERYRPGGEPPKPQAAAPTSTAKAPLDPALLGLFSGMKVKTEEERVTLVTEKHFYEFGVHQLQGLLKIVGVEIPEEADLSVNEHGYLRVEWRKERYES